MKSQEPEDLEARLSALAQRVQRLERRNRRQRWAVAGLAAAPGVGLFGFGLQAQTTKAAGAVRAMTGEMLSIVDRQGQEKLRLEALTGHPWIYLRGQPDQKGTPVGGLQIMVNEGAPMVSCNGSHRGGISIGTMPPDRPFLEMRDAEGKVRARLQLNAKGDPRLELLKKDGKVFWKTP